MITYMQFIDKGISFSVSAATTKNEVDFTMEDLNNEMAYDSISLKIEELVQLRNWLNKAIDILKEPDEVEGKAEAP